jgi:hypothetical protein
MGLQSQFGCREKRRVSGKALKCLTRPVSAMSVNRHDSSAGSISLSTAIASGQTTPSKLSGHYEILAPSSSTRLSLGFREESTMTPGGGDHARRRRPLSGSALRTACLGPLARWRGGVRAAEVGAVSLRPASGRRRQAQFLSLIQEVLDGGCRPLPAAPCDGAGWTSTKDRTKARPDTDLFGRRDGDYRVVTSGAPAIDHMAARTPAPTRSAPDQPFCSASRR